MRKEGETVFTAATLGLTQVLALRLTAHWTEQRNNHQLNLN